jgi:hypothetical protein
MIPTRRQFNRTLLLAPAALAVCSPNRLLAQQEPDPFGGETPPNVFFSPCGRPFRAKDGQPYPVVDWFKKADTDGDGKLDHAEFIADAMAFFKILDRNGDGVISPQELAFYEQRIAPEVLGMRVIVRRDRMIEAKPRLWLAQGMPGGGMGGGVLPQGESTEGDSQDETGKARPYDASGKGASPYGFFDEPEPVAAADLHFRGLISKADFTDLANAHFKTLDKDGTGFLTLATLPKTPVQRRLERGRHGRRG